MCAIFQRYDLLPIHNELHPCAQAGDSVCNISKIRSVTNSQLLLLFAPDLVECVQYFKDTICYQFTTLSGGEGTFFTVCAIFQRYDLLPIHNSCASHESAKSSVCNISKIRSVTNSQPLTCSIHKCLECVQYFKDTICYQFTTVMCLGAETVAVCAIFQRYDLLPIHNSGLSLYPDKPSVCNISKIRSVTNSQLRLAAGIQHCECVQYFKDTICYQFTTRIQCMVMLLSVCAIFQRYDLLPIHNLCGRGH